MKLNKVPLSLFVVCVLTVFANRTFAQQSRVDSVVQLLNISISKQALDTVSFEKALNLLNATSLTDNQINQFETKVIPLMKWDTISATNEIRLGIFYSLINTDANRAINYGKLQIENLDKLNIPLATNYTDYYLSILRFPFRNSSMFEEGFKYYTQKLSEYKTRNDSVCIAECYFVLAGFYRISGITDLAIYDMKKSCSYLDTLTNKGAWINNIGNVGNLYLIKGDKTGCLKYSRIAVDEYLKEKTGYDVNAYDIARMFLKSNELDSAAYYIKLAKQDPNQSDESIACFLQYDALYKIQSGDLDEADSLLNKSWQLIIKNKIAVNSAPGTIAPDYYIALIRIKQNKFDEAIALLKKDIERLLNNRLDILRDYKLMAELYQKTGKPEKASETFAIYNAKLDSLLADQDKYRSYSFEAEQRMSEKELSIAKLESENKISALGKNFSIGIAVLLLLIAAGIYNRFQTKKKANLILEKTLADLKATQQQLVQQEKLASLGALTAGIAHEIKNPLNFVNNFADLSNELIDEFLVADSEDERKEIAVDLKNNLSKITQHGKRADSIVKNMLEHSRSGNSEKQLTDINAICEEYLNLAYHGMRAANQDFNCAFNFIGNKDLPAVNCVSQDISRVVLNLINNAFYAVNEKRIKAVAANQIFEPHVTVTTHFNNNQIQIEVTDNGNGMNETVRSRLFQPFFTTKPSGKGTGLGLSLSYDIVKAHGGEIKVESTENVSTKFIISLPL